MRFVDLSREDGETCHDKVVRLGCGPNFIRNRSELFEKMIREQGLQFWFRFWLTFCCNHGMREFEEINKLLPGVTACLMKDIHINFVQASSTDAINFCWNNIFPSNPPSKRILDEMYQFMEIGFGSALGEVFFKWLVAKDLPPNAQDLKEYKDYWKIPCQYLDPTFQPGQLEKYLVKQWGNKFIKLLGVSKDQVTWIRKLLVNKGDFESESDKKPLHHYHMQYSHGRAVRKLVEGWKVKLKHMKNAIQMSDELKKVDEMQCGVKTTKFKQNSKVMLHVNEERLFQPEKITFSEITTDDCSEKDTVENQLQCSCCTVTKRLKKCQRCEEENWVHPRFYCCVACQSKDWFAKHEREHCQYLQRSLLETAKLHQFLQLAARPKCEKKC